MTDFTYHVRYKPIFTIHVFSHQVHPLLEGVKNRNHIKGCQRALETMVSLTNARNTVSRVYWYEATALCSSRASANWSQQKIHGIAVKIRGSSSVFFWVRLVSLYSNSTLSPTGNSLAQEVFPQNPLWCTASLFHAPLLIVALRFGHVKTSLLCSCLDALK